MDTPGSTAELHLHPQPWEDVTLSIPSKTLETIRMVAAARDMSVEALMKLYVGQALRQDAARLYSDRILQTTAEVLARHIESEEERRAILREIQGGAAA